MDIGLIEGLVAALVPLLVEATLRWVWRAPKWVVVTILVPVLGAALQALQVVVAGGEFSPLIGVVLGAVGVYLAELVKQLSRAGAAVRRGDPTPLVTARKRR